MFTSFVCGSLLSWTSGIGGVWSRRSGSRARYVSQILDYRARYTEIPMRALQPKITIALLDQDDLRPLAHLMNSYPAVLKEKALLVQASQTK